MRHLLATAALLLPALALSPTASALPPCDDNGPPVQAACMCPSAHSDICEICPVYIAKPEGIPHGDHVYGCMGFWLCGDDWREICETITRPYTTSPP